VHNVIPVTDKMISGSAPEGDAGFDMLQEMGVRTIISVDGTEPDVERARARGMRYVHLPVGYHGIDAVRQLELAKAVCDLPGPVYVHCHHGKHRGPAAAASAALLLGDLSPEQGVAFMKKAGTSDHYSGLYTCVREAEPAGEAALAAAPAEFPEVAPMPGFVRAMARAQEAYDHMVEIRDAGWKTPAAHPDLVLVEEAERLEQLLAGVQQDERVAEHPTDFEGMLKESWEAGAEMLAAVRAAEPHSELTAGLRRVGETCKNCHVQYRDEK
jgi:protein tyrosine phosphatase (PTP) superfamily phosphohydrolase (DUF442 family)/cytochrome c556